MKLRIKGNSIRLRLSQSDVERLSREGSVEESTAFPGDAQLAYAIRADAALEAPTASFSLERLTVHLPPAEVKQWADSDRISIEASDETAQGPLRILVEKDFECLSGRHDEDSKDAFPNPRTKPPAE